MEMDNYTTIPLITFVPFFHSIGFFYWLVIFTIPFYKYPCLKPNSFNSTLLLPLLLSYYKFLSISNNSFTHFYSFYKSLTIFIQKSIFNSSFFTRYYHYTILSSILFTRLYFTRLYFIYYFHKAKLHLRKNLLPNSSLVCRKISSPRR